MSVYIKDMEMPEDGRYTLCITHDSNGGVHWVFQNQTTLEFLKHKGVTELRPHGRLIDAYALGEDLARAIPWAIETPEEHAYLDGLAAAYAMVNAAPTIIPAEESLRCNPCKPTQPE